LKERNQLDKGGPTIRKEKKEVARAASKRTRRGKVHTRTLLKPKENEGKVFIKGGDGVGIGWQKIM